MKQEDIQLLLVDLCGRLPYGVKVTFAGYSGRDDCILNYQHLNGTYAIEYLRLRPYLRPMSSMTEEEIDEFTQFDVYADGEYVMSNYEIIDWLNAHHFDYRGLIEKNLALDCTELHIYD